MADRRIQIALTALTEAAREDLALVRLRAVAGSDFPDYLEAAAEAAAAGVSPLQLHSFAVMHARGAMFPTVLPQPTDRLPLLCRLRRHGWRAERVRGGWVRQTCDRCADLDLPTP